MNIEIGGCGFFGLLTLLFIALKLLGHIAWSWWWVLSPILIPIGIGAIFLLVLGLIAIIIGVLDL